jgi:hypothetical protein
MVTMMLMMLVVTLVILVVNHQHSSPLVAFLKL